MKITPIADIERRLPEHGRIRIGEKGAKGAPKKIDTFRFTSPDKEAIEQLAALYGGEVKPWEQGQWEVKSEAKAVPVVLPPDPLGGTPVYELWSGGGCLRRCDGETCLVPKQTQGGAEMVETPCICDRQGKLECKPKTRLNVILAEIRFGGAWRLESGGWNTAHELPGMVDMIQALQQKGMSRAELALEERVSKFGGQTRRFVVPVLRPVTSVNLMIEGQGSVLALGKASSDEIPEGEDTGLSAAEELRLAEAGVHIPATPSDDWDIVDAELVESESGVATQQTPTPATDVPVEIERMRKKAHAMLREIGMGNTERHALVKRITNGVNSSLNDLGEGGLEVMIAALTALKNAQAFYEGEDENGMAVVTRA